MSILAIDYGQRKIGLALSDETNLVGSALPMLHVHDEADALVKLGEAVTKFKPERILFGIPSGWQNVDSPQTTSVRSFKTKFAEACPVDIVEWDESYSSKIAAKNITGKQKKNSDSYAAAIILQEYLDYLRYEKHS